MDEEIGTRLRAAADRCIKAYDIWSGSKKDAGSRDELMEAVHELRKVSSRLEIEIAVSERDEVTARPLPIPPHRAASRGRQPQGTDMPGDKDQTGGGGDDGMSMRRRMNRGPRLMPGATERGSEQE